MNIKFIRISFIALCLSAFFLLASEAFFIVTNSNREDSNFPGQESPPQDMSSGLFSGYIGADSDYEKMKAKGATILGGCCETKPSHIKKISSLKN